jgi:hypothetical protein
MQSDLHRGRNTSNESCARYGLGSAHVDRTPQFTFVYEVINHANQVIQRDPAYVAVAVADDGS